MLHVHQIDADELPNWHRVRTTVYLERGYINDTELNADGLYVDTHDAHALHIAAYWLDEMIGTFRLIYRVGGEQTLPVEELFELILPAGSTAVEPSGLAPLLLQGVFALAVEAGADCLYPVLERPMIRFLQDIIGLPVEIISGPKQVYHTTNWAVRCPVGDIVTSVEKKDRTRRGSKKYAPIFAEVFPL
jgi:N-acyl-L-homoserine lactone synthetase